MKRRRLLWVLPVLLLASLSGTAVQQPAPSKKESQSGSKKPAASQPEQTPEEREYEAKRAAMPPGTHQPPPLQEEAENARRDCEKGPILGNFYDCSCVARSSRKAGSG